MTPFKWFQLTCQIILTVSPFVLVYRDYRHKTDTKLYHWITILSLAVCAVAAIGAGYGLYREMSKTEKSPQYSLYLDKYEIHDGDIITLPAVNRFVDFRFLLSNRGNATDDGIRLLLSFPKQLQFIQHDSWEIFDSAMTTTSELQKLDNNLLMGSVPTSLGIGHGYSFPSIIIQTLEQQPESVNELRAIIDSNKGERKIVNFSVHVTKTGTSHRGY